jgi:hypothetical protein
LVTKVHEASQKEWRVNKLASEKVVIAAPMSFAGSAQRIWKLTAVDNPVGKAALGVLAVMLIVVAWSVIVVWYCIFGLLVVPYRLIRRGSRKRKRQGLQHRELLGAMGVVQQAVVSTSPAPPVPAEWHPDPLARHELRYWDGTRWTDHVSDHGHQSIESAAPPAVSAPTTSAPELPPPVT